MGDWSPNPSPRAFVPSFLNEEFGSRSFSDMLSENGTEAPVDHENKKNDLYIKEEEQGEPDIKFSGSLMFELNSFDPHKSNSRGGFSERRALRAGFNPLTLNTARVPSATMASSSSDAGSPYLTIPPGLSPTMLLDSPVFLSNSMVQPSPTTGKVLFAHSNNPNVSRGQHLDEIAPETFAFKPHLDSSSSYFSRTENKGLLPFDQQKPLSGMDASAQDFNLHPDTRKKTASENIFNQRVSDSFTGNENSSTPEDQPDGEADSKAELSSGAGGSAPAEDGYNWRKYGQKQVKGSEYPRSYYKCTHVNCQVKKKVERNHDGQITEIIYKANHNHPMPPPNRRSIGDQFDGSENTGRDSASITAEFGDQAAPVQNQDRNRYEPSDAIDVSSTLSNDEDEDDRATHGSVSLGGGDAEGDETESKRIKLDVVSTELSAASRAVREPRVVVQTTSEVDILDDGYRWRKYGQKVVKGNPNPRSYYKCTNPGCTVRKHVERASHDLKSVITTYEGKHNHDVPAARNSGSHGGSLTSSATTTSAPQAHTAHRRPELNHDGLMRFDGRPQHGAFAHHSREPMGSMAGFGLGNGEMSSVGPMKLPGLPPVRPFIGYHQAPAGFMMPKGEPKEEPTAESERVVSIYHQMMGRLPFGP